MSLWRLVLRRLPGPRMQLAHHRLSWRTGLASCPQLRQLKPAQLSGKPAGRHVHVQAVMSGGVKTKSVYRCTECGKETAQWNGRCPGCSEWNTLEEVVVSAGKAGSSGGGGGIAAAARTVEPSTSGRSMASSSSGGWPARRGAREVVASLPTSTKRGGWVDSYGNRPQRIRDIGKGGFGVAWRLPLTGPGGAELARVMGGGVVPGSLTLIGGDPGVGKSTLLLQVAAMLSQEDSSSAAAAEAVPGQPLDSDDPPPDLAGQAVLYVSAEESVDQVGSRAERMGLAGSENVYLYSATRMEDILREIVTMQPRGVIIDSIQTVYLDDIAGSAGSVSQVRECATALLHVAKREGIPIFLVGHVTKAGDIAGPRVLEHIVDTVLFMEGERHQAYRLIRGIKNRYGATDEVGVFRMDEAGLVAVDNPSALFLSDRSANPGVSSAVTVMVEGTRPLLLEVQALTSPVHQGQGAPFRSPTGVDRNRLSLILAVLAKHCRLRTHTMDLYTNVVGGLRMLEPATDLAVALAVASSYYEMPIAQDVAVVGEIGLGGELRAVSHIDRRLLEAAKLGFRTLIIPASHAAPKSARLAGVRVVRCGTVADAIRAVLGGSLRRPRHGDGSDDDFED